ncbi:DRTGG domain-containing protein [Acetonema longum]|uniref:HPr kinase n=1 Tax=Acetonema longum DSM 6540 TaxID=1009370 RepID=F7NHM8_9FIRM|nr:DRTGG domain-containing protein [Acetonema longum]EGO64403.1 HPr kinase [Acetonema longum DSM 6540]
MTVRDLVSALSLEVGAGESMLDEPVTGGYVSDLLSNVMGQAQPGQIWVTVQAHQNIIAVASLAGLAAVLLAGEVRPENEVLQKAESEKVPVLLSPLPAYELVGRLFQLGVRGM